MGVDRIFEVYWDVELSENWLELKKKRKLEEKKIGRIEIKKRTTGRSAFCSKRRVVCCMCIVVQCWKQTACRLAS